METLFGNAYTSLSSKEMQQLATVYAPLPRDADYDLATYLFAKKHVEPHEGGRVQWPDPKGNSTQELVLVGSYHSASHQDDRLSIALTVPLQKGSKQLALVYVDPQEVTWTALWLRGKQPASWLYSAHGHASAKNIERTKMTISALERSLQNALSEARTIVKRNKLVQTLDWSYRPSVPRTQP